MDKLNVVYPFNGILFSHKKEWSPDRCYNMDEPREHCAQWRKPEIKGHKLCDPIPMKCLEYTN